MFHVIDNDKLDLKIKKPKTALFDANIVNAVKF